MGRVKTETKMTNQLSKTLPIVVHTHGKQPIIFQSIPFYQPNYRSAFKLFYLLTKITIGSIYTNMEQQQKKQSSQITIKIWRTTLSRLRLLAALREMSMVKIIDELVSDALSECKENFLMRKKVTDK